MSRASHYRAVNRHAQRTYAQVKPKPANPDVATMWIGDAVAQLRNGQVLTLADGFGAELGELKLRELSRRGLVTMDAVWVEGKFSHFTWTVISGLAD